MNFDELKKDMNQSIDADKSAPIELDLGRGKNNPVAVIRKNMKREIITQLVCIVVFMIYPVLIPMEPLNEAVYYIFIFITSLMTLMYIIKLSYFLSKTNSFTSNTRDAIKNFIFQAKLTLEVYKSFIIAGSLLLPIPVFALIGNKKSGGSVNFERWFLLDVSATELTFLVVGYLLAAAIFYYITRYWTQLLYGKYLTDLEGLVKDLED